MATYDLIGGLGGIRTVCPSPIDERSVLFRLGFRFVRVVRALRVGEAKPHGRMTIVVLIAERLG